MTIELLKKRASFVQGLRNFFIENDYLEVETPALCPYLLPEPSIEVFDTQLIRPECKSIPLFLAPSPELWMKRMLSKGTGSIFQISKCNRHI